FMGLPNSLDFCISLYGILWAGATAVLVNQRWTQYEVENAWALVEPKLVVGEKKNPSMNNSKWATYETPDLLKMSSAPMKARGTSDEGVLNSPAVFLLTSGTTGKPKAVMLTQSAIFSNASQLAKRKELTPKDRFLCSVPLFHSNGQVAALQSMLVAGSSLVMMDRFTPESLLQGVQKYKATAITGVPTLYQYLVNYHANNPVDLSTLRICSCGSAPMPVSLFEEVESKFGAFILEGYGLTETSAGLCGNRISKRKIGTVGPALDGTDLIIVDDFDKQVKAGETGEILARGPQLMTGYFRDEAGTQSAFAPGGYVRTGDIGSLDEDGYVTIKSRKKELIIRGGFNIYPVEVENVLRSIDGVLDVAVVGLPDPLHGETVHAALITDLKEEDLTPLLKRFSEERLARYKRPTTFSLHKDFPRTASAKVQRTFLQTQLTGEPEKIRSL
ncbi:MAG: AMP-binding protein, partial [Bdellovibrionia bacterium]